MKNDFNFSLKIPMVNGVTKEAVISATDREMKNIVIADKLMQCEAEGKDAVPLARKLSKCLHSIVYAVSTENVHYMVAFDNGGFYDGFLAEWKDKQPKEYISNDGSHFDYALTIQDKATGASFDITGNQCTEKELQKFADLVTCHPKDIAFTFADASQMLSYLQDNDMYNPETEEYVFGYNDEGSICVYSGISMEQARALQGMAEKDKCNWSDMLGMSSSQIYDKGDNMAYCEETCADKWISCKSVFEYENEQERDCISLD